MEKKNKISLKNYIIVSVTFILVIVFTLLVKNWYDSYKKYQLNVPVLSGKMQEIRSDEFDNYIMEHDNFILYIGVAYDLDCRKLEKEMLNNLENENILTNIIYLNITQVNDKNAYLKKLLKSYGKEINIGYPSVLLINNNKIADIITKTSNKSLKISDVKNILKEYEIIK